MNLLKTIQESTLLLSETWKEQYASFLEEEPVYAPAGRHRQVQLAILYASSRLYKTVFH